MFRIFPKPRNSSGPPPGVCEEGSQTSPPSQRPEGSSELLLTLIPGLGLELRFAEKPSEGSLKSLSGNFELSRIFFSVRLWSLLESPIGALHPALSPFNLHLQTPIGHNPGKGQNLRL